MLDVFLVLGGDGKKISPFGDIFYHPPCERSSICSKLANNVGDHVVLSPVGAVLVLSPGTESCGIPPYPPPPPNR